MANNPIDTNSFTHFLEIRGEEKQIVEPDNFNQANFKVVQEDIARDKFIGNEEAQLEFSNAYGGQTNTFINNNGVPINHLWSGLELLLQENKDYGNEADVKDILKKNNVTFTTGNYDFSEDFETDGVTKLKCRVIQNTNQAKIKKREDVTIDLLATKDLDDNDIDAIKQSYKAIGSLPVNAEKYDVGGKYYNNFLFSKNLIKQDLTKLFYIKLTDIKKDLLEQCAYAQVNDTEIYIGQYPDYYNNTDMGGFVEVADYESKFTKNPKYLVSKFIFGYEKIEQDRTAEKTSDAIHTNSEFFIQTQNSINTKEIKLPFARDGYLIEFERDLIFAKGQTSTDNDNTIFKTEITQLPPNSRGGFTRYLTYQTKAVEGVFQIQRNDTFSWDLLGFNVGNTIIINDVSHVVLAITPTILTVTWSGVNFSGAGFLTFDYPLTNVLYTVRTNQGLIFSENLSNPSTTVNINYSIKRSILESWKYVLATYGKFIPGKKVKNTYFKSNGECTTQFLGEDEPIKENDDILISDISEFKILNQELYTCRVNCEFEQAVQLLGDIQNVRGFIRVQAPDGSIVKGYIQEANVFWSDDVLNLVLECKNESDFLTVDYADGILTINEVGYTEQTTNIKLYNIFKDYIQFFDTNNVNLCKRTKFDKVLLNGISYSSVTDLVNAIELL